MAILGLTQPTQYDTLPNALLAYSDPRLAAGQSAATAVANRAYGFRVVCRKSGTLASIYCINTASTGNYDVGVYDTAPTTRTALYRKGSTAMPTAGQMLLASPNLSVYAGQHVDLVIAFDGTPAIARHHGTSVTAGCQVPTAAFPSPDGGLANLYWTVDTSMPLPATFSEAGHSASNILAFAIFGVIS